MTDGMMRWLRNRTAGLSRKVARWRDIYKSHVVPSAPLCPSYLDYVRQRPIVFAAWFHWRRLVYGMFPLTRVRRRQTEFRNRSAKAHLVEKVIPHNQGLQRRISRSRTEKLMYLLRSVEGLSPKSCRVLCIGPRNEAEILLLSLHGFSRQHITAIDLFSQSPLIQVMDMHELRFPDDHFDIVYSSYVLRYSSDVQRACAEMVRVTKDSGLVAIAYVYGGEGGEFGTVLNGGLQELFGYFGSSIKATYWQEEFSRPSGETIVTTIFRISKTSAGNKTLEQPADHELILSR